MGDLVGVTVVVVGHIGPDLEPVLQFDIGLELTAEGGTRRGRGRRTTSGKALVVRHLESHNAEVLQEGILPVPVHGLGDTFRIEVVVPSQFGAVPRIGELACGHREGLEPLRVIGHESLVDADRLAGVEGIKSLVGGERVVEGAAGDAKPAGDFVVEFGGGVQAQPESFAVLGDAGGDIDRPAAKRVFVTQTQVAAEVERTKSLDPGFQGLLGCRHFLFNFADLIAQVFLVLRNRPKGDGRAALFLGRSRGLFAGAHFAKLLAEPFQLLLLLAHRLALCF